MKSHISTHVRFRWRRLALRSRGGDSCAAVSLRGPTGMLAQLHVQRENGRGAHVSPTPVNITTIGAH